VNRIRLAAIVFIVFSLGMLPFAWALGISPMLSQAREAEDLTVTTRTELAIATQTLGELRAASEQLGEARAELDRLRRAIPEQPRTEEIAAAFGRSAQSLGVEIQELIFSPPQAVAGEELDATLAARLLSISITGRASGPLDDVLAFIEDVQTDTRITLVNDVRLTTGEVAILEFSGAALVLAPADVAAAAPSESAPTAEPQPAE